MSPYFVFVIALTVAYIIYFAVMIMKDLQVKKESQSNEGEEFSIELDETPEDSITVAESPSGFSVGDSTYDTDLSQGVDQAHDKGRSDTSSKSRLEQLKSMQEEQMEECSSFLSNPYTKEELTQSLLSKGKIDNRPELEWKSVNDKL